MYKKNIAIIGDDTDLCMVMAQALADKMKMFYLNAADYIEYTTNMSVNAILSCYGINKYKSVIKSKLVGLADYDDTVIGLMNDALNAENLCLLSEYCYTVYMPKKRMYERYAKIADIAYKFNNDIDHSIRIIKEKLGEKIGNECF